MATRLLLAMLCAAAGACGASVDDAAPKGTAGTDEMPAPDPTMPAPVRSAPATDAGTTGTADPAASPAADGSTERAPARTDGGSAATTDARAVPDAAPIVVGDGGVVLAWDGETRPTGSCWGKPLSGGTARCSLSTLQSSPAGKSPNHAWLFDIHTGGPTEGGWNWGHAVSITNARYVVFWVKVTGDVPQRDFVVSLRDAATGTYSIDHKGFLGGSIRKFSPTFSDGNWNQVRMPLTDVFGVLPRFAAVTELCIRGGSTANASFQIFVDDIGFSP